MTEKQCNCDAKHTLFIQYSWDHPDHYDGVSEVRCQKCGRRWGRWSGRELKGTETEPRYGTRERR